MCKAVWQKATLLINASHVPYRIYFPYLVTPYGDKCTCPLCASDRQTMYSMHAGWVPMWYNGMAHVPLKIAPSHEDVPHLIQGSLGLHKSAPWHLELISTAVFCTAYWYAQHKDTHTTLHVTSKASGASMYWVKSMWTKSSNECISLAQSTKS